MNHHRKNGFTLIELLIAMTICSLMAVASWQVFYQLNTAEQNVSLKKEQLSQLQFAYMQINQDVLDYVNRVGRSPEFSNHSNVNNDESFNLGFDLIENQLSFTKKSSIDPRLIDAKGVNHNPAFERITFKQKDTQLMRYSSKDIDNNNSAVLSVALLDDVKDLTIVALDPAANATWPPYESNDDIEDIESQAETEQTDEQLIQEATYIPLGFMMTFKYHGVDVKWKFAMIASLPEIKNNSVSSPKK